LKVFKPTVYVSRARGVVKRRQTPQRNGAGIWWLLADMTRIRGILGCGGRIRRFFPDPIYIHYKFLNMF